MRNRINKTLLQEWLIGLTGGDKNKTRIGMLIDDLTKHGKAGFKSKYYDYDYR